MHFHPFAFHHDSGREYAAAVGAADDGGDSELRAERGQLVTVTLFGVSDDARTVVVELVGTPLQLKAMLPHLNRHLPVAATPAEGARLALEPYAARDVARAVLAAAGVDPETCDAELTLDAERPLYGYCGPERFPFLTLRTPRAQLFYRIRNALQQTPVQLAPFAAPVHLKLGDLDYDPVQRTLAGFGPPAAWYTLPVDTDGELEEAGGVAIPAGQEAVADAHFRFRFRSCADGPLRLLPDAEAERLGVPPLLTQSFDIECLGRPDRKLGAEFYREPDSAITSLANAWVRGNGVGDPACGRVRNSVYMLLPFRDDASSRVWLVDIPDWVARDAAEDGPVTRRLRARLGYAPTRDNAPRLADLPTHVPCSHGPPATVHYHWHEGRMLRAWIGETAEQNAMVYTGYNFTYFDWELILARCGVHQLERELLARLSMLRWQPGAVTRSDKQSNAKLAVGKCFPDLPGRVNIDAIDEARNTKIQNYNMETVARHFLGEGKVPNNFEEQWYLWYMGHVQHELPYVMVDAELPQKLLSGAVKGGWNTLLALCQRSAFVMGVPRLFVDSMMQASVDTMLTTEGTRHGFVMMNRDFQGLRSLEYAREQAASVEQRYAVVPQQAMLRSGAATVARALAPAPATARPHPIEAVARSGPRLRQPLLNPYGDPLWELERTVAFPPDNPSFQGGLVQEPLFGVHLALGCLDFMSLYPSEQEKNHLCWTTIVVEERYANLPGVEYRDIAFDQEGVHYKFRWAQDPDALIVGIIRRLKEKRKFYKNEMKRNARDRDAARAKANAARAEGREDEARAFDAEADFHAALYELNNIRQLQVKLLMNSIFGFASVQAGMGKRPCWMLGACICRCGREDITTVVNMMRERGFVVVYGDSVVGDTPLLVRRHGGAVETCRIDELVADPCAWTLMEGGAVCKEMALVEGVEVLDERGFTTVRRVIRHACRKPLVDVHLADGAGSVTCTADHSLLLAGGEIVAPRDLRPGDALLCVDNAALVGALDSAARPPTAPPPPDEDSAFLWGLFAARGRVCRDTLHWSLLVRSEEHVARARRLLPFATSVLVLRRGRWCGTAFRITPAGREARATAVRVFAALFLNRAGECIVPHALLTAPAAIVRVFLDAYGANLDHFSWHTKQLALGISLLRLRDGGGDGDSGDGDSALVDVVRTSGQAPTSSVLAHQVVYDLETDSHHFHVGPGRLVVHNTDSAMCKLPDIENRLMALSDAFVAGRLSEDELQAAVDAILLEVREVMSKLADDLSRATGLVLEFENIYWPFMAFTKKRYIRAIIASNATTVPRDLYEKCVVGQGTKTARRDAMLFNKNLLEDVYSVSLRTRSIVAVLRCAAAAAMRLMRGEVPPEEAVREQTLTKYLPYMIPPGKYVPAQSRYNLASPEPHTVAAMREFRRAPQLAPVFGSKVAYVPVWPEPRLGMAANCAKSERVMTLTELRETGARINYADVFDGVRAELVQVLVALDKRPVDKQDPRIHAGLSAEWEARFENNFLTPLRQRQAGQMNFVMRDALAQYEEVRAAPTTTASDLAAAETRMLDTIFGISEPRQTPRPRNAKKKSSTSKSKKKNERARALEERRRLLCGERSLEDEEKAQAAAEAAAAVSQSAPAQGLAAFFSGGPSSSSSLPHPLPPPPSLPKSTTKAHRVPPPPPRKSSLQAFFMSADNAGSSSSK